MKRFKLKTVSIFSLIVATMGILSSLPAKYVEAPDAYSNKAQNNLSSATSAEKIAKDCDIFNQTDTDILAQLPSDKECYFAGCGGLF